MRPMCSPLIAKATGWKWKSVNEEHGGVSSLLEVLHPVAGHPFLEADELVIGAKRKTAIPETVMEVGQLYAVEFHPHRYFTVDVALVYFIHHLDKI